MAPKYHPTPLSGGDRKALTKELGKARAMANILAAQSAEMRAKGEAMIQQAANDLADKAEGIAAVGVPFERRWPLITMLLAPGRPALANVNFGALLECGQSDLDLYGLRFLTRRALLLNDVDARCTAIPFNSEPCRITS
jgi:hypothetical protein